MPSLTRQDSVHYTEPSATSAPTPPSPAQPTEQCRENSQNTRGNRISKAQRNSIYTKAIMAGSGDCLNFDVITLIHSYVIGSSYVTRITLIVLLALITLSIALSV